MNMSEEYVEDEITIKGFSKYQRDLNVKSINIIGSGQFDGRIFTESFENYGTTKVKNVCEAKKITNLGHCGFQSIECKNIYSSGSLYVDQSIVTEEFHSKGAVHIKNALTAQNVLINITAPSHIGKIIGSKTVKIATHSLSNFNILYLNRKKLVCNSIEGTHIKVKHTEADIIIGEEIDIGPGCYIKEVRYSKKLKINSNSKVLHYEHISSDS